jgi:hypothetical protein
MVNKYMNQHAHAPFTSKGTLAAEHILKPGIFRSNPGKSRRSSKNSSLAIYNKVSHGLNSMSVLLSNGVGRALLLRKQVGLSPVLLALPGLRGAGSIPHVSQSK